MLAKAAGNLHAKSHLCLQDHRECLKNIQQCIQVAVFVKVWTRLGI